MTESLISAAATVRNVVIGSHSKVWHGLHPRLSHAGCKFEAIGHRDVERFAFTPEDRVWVLSYSRLAQQNAELLQRLGRAGVGEIVYVSSSSTIVRQLTTCYEYPYVKHQAELDALAWPNARVLTIGLMYEQPAELPGGANVATSFDELAAFICAPSWPDDAGRRKRLFAVVQRPFANALDRQLYRVYGVLLRWVGRYPCILRPLDLLLRAIGARWYGYVYLSNRLWISTIS